MPDKDRESFARKLCSLYDEFYETDFDASKYSEEVMQLFLEFASVTPRNQRCFELIEFGSDTANIDSDSIEYGFKLKGRPYNYLANILNSLEAISVPEAIEFRDMFPDMTQEEWEVAMRMCTVILAAFSPMKPK